MHHEATLSLYSMTDRVGKLCRRDLSGDGDKFAAAPIFALLFREMNQGSQRVRMTDVSKFMLITKPAATQAVNRLVEKGLVERVSDESDRRVVYIQPTEAGKAFFQRELDHKLNMVDRVVDRMGEENVNQLVGLLDQFLSEASTLMEEN